MSKKEFKRLIKDKKGLMYTTELLLTLILIIFIIGTMASLSDSMNEKMLSEEELSSLEDISIESADYLINNPGNPQNWEDDDSLDNGIVSKDIIPGLAIKRKNVENGFFKDESKESEETISNTISYEKLMKVKNNYEDLINRNLFNGSFKSSIAVYPINKNMEAIVMGDDLNELENDVVVVNRSLQCDYYTNFVVYKFNDFELYGDSYQRKELCNHDTNPYLENHTGDSRSFWLCKSFRIYRSSLENYNYYLISDKDVKRTESYYILESMNRSTDEKKRIDSEVIDLNPFFTEDMENSSNEIYSIHFNVAKDDADNFRSLLVAIPKNMSEEIISKNQLNYDYFSTQEVNFVLKTSFK